MASKKNPKKYIIRSGDRSLLSTDDKDKALKKADDLMATKVEQFSLTDNTAGTYTVYTKDRYQKNYRVTTRKLPQGDK